MCEHVRSKNLIEPHPSRPVSSRLISFHCAFSAAIQCAENTAREPRDPVSAREGSGFTHAWRAVSTRGPAATTRSGTLLSPAGRHCAARIVAAGLAW